MLFECLMPAKCLPQMYSVPRFYQRPLDRWASVGVSILSIARRSAQPHRRLDFGPAKRILYTLYRPSCRPPFSPPSTETHHHPKGITLVTLSAARSPFHDTLETAVRPSVGSVAHTSPSLLTIFRICWGFVKGIPQITSHKTIAGGHIADTRRAHT